MRAAANIRFLMLAITFALLLNLASASGSAPGGAFSGCANTCGTGCPASGYSTAQCSSTQPYTCDSGSCSTTCNLCASITTQYQSNANYQLQTSVASASPATLSPAVSINQYNIGNSGWFLTCPEPLAPGLGDTAPADNSLFYPYTADGQFQYVGGDACLATTTPLTSTIDLPVSIGWTVGPAGALYAAATVEPLSVSQSSNLQVSQLAYSPQLDTGSGSVIPSSFAVNSYIFQPVPAIAQNDIWSWSAPFANLGSVSQDQQTVTATPSRTFSYPNPESCGGDEPACPTCTPVPPATKCTTPPSPIYSEPYSCTYTYAYTETTTLKSVQNQQIPFNEVNVLANPDGKSAPTVTYNNFLTPILPYFALHYNMQALDGQRMYNSYDVFGPWSYNTPINSIEMFPIDTPSQFLFNYKTSKGNMLFSLQSGSLNGLGQLNNLLGNMLNLLGNLIGGGHGNKNGVYKNLAKFGLKTPYISSPLSIVQISNDYIFVLNYSDSNICDSNNVCGNGEYYLSVLRLVPRGYYNTSTDQPNSVPAVVQTTGNGQTSLQDCQTNPDGTFGNCVPGSAGTPKQEWLNNWNGYWANVIDAQNSSVYVVRSIDLGNGQGTFTVQDESNYYLDYYLGHVSQSPSCTQGACQTIDTFAPYNITADSRGDVFIVGYATDSTNNVNYPGIIEIPIANGPTAPTPANDNPSFTSGDWSVSGQAPPLTEIAATSDGTWVYASSPTLGTIYQFNANTNPIAMNEQAGLAFSTTGSPGQIQSATQSGVQSSLNIAAYLEQGGLYGIPFNDQGPYWSLALAPEGATTQNPNNQGIATDFDTNAFHHVIGLANVNGYIYVLDDWRGRIGYSNGVSWGACWTFWSCPSTSGGTYFDILLMRVLDSSGANVPINPTMFNDLYTTQGCAVQYCSVNQNPCPSQDQRNGYSPSSCIPTSGSAVYPECNPSNLCWQAHTGCTATGGQNGDREFCAAVGGTSAGSSSYYTLSSPGFFASQGVQVYPPYGWPLSANLTPASSSGDYPIGFCSSYGTTRISGSSGGVLPTCQFNPKNIKSECELYENPADWGNCQWSPIGPALNAQHSDLSGTGFSESLNGTLTLLFKKNTACTSWICLGFIGSQASDPLYNELLSSTFAVENYTKYFDSNIGYSCYTDDSSNGGTNGACGLLGATGTDYLAKIIPPIFTTTNPFRYLESLGGTQVLTITGAGSTSVSSGQSCTGTASASGCSYGYTCPGGNDCSGGPPQLTFSAYPGNWNTPDIISLTTSGSGESQNDQLQLTITDQNNNQVAGSPVTGIGGAVSYTVCTTGPCLVPGTYSVQGEDTTTGDTVSDTNFVINDQPSISLQSPQLITSSGGSTSEAVEAITVQTFNPADGISLAITDANGATVASASCPSVASATSKNPACNGALQYSESTLGVGQYTVTATDTSTSKSSAQPLLVEQPSATTTPSTGGAETLSSTLSGYVLVPYEYTYSLHQTWSNPTPTISGSDGDETCSTPPPGWPSSPQDTQADVFSYALTTGQSNMLSAVVEGGGTYLEESTNNNYYIANLTDANLVLPPQILYNVQNDRLFGTIWVNATYCDTPQASGSVCTSYANNNQAILNATVQQQYSISASNEYSGVCTSQGCPTSGGYETFGASQTAGTIYGGKLITSSPGKLASEEYASGSVTTPSNGGVSITLSKSPVTIRNSVTISGTTISGDSLELLVGGYCVSNCPSAPPTTPTTTVIPPISFTVSSASCASSSCSATLGFVAAGTYQVEAQDLTNGQSQTATLVVLPQQIGFSYQNNPFFTSVPLFDLYKQVVYSSPLYLLLNDTQYSVPGAATGPGPYPLRGYQQLVYVMNDRFNNLIYAPVEADIAEPVQLTLNIQAAPSVSNPNETTIKINGVAGSYTSLGSIFQPLPEGQQIYLYYNDNLNFVDYNPLSQSTADTNGQPISVQGQTLTQQQAAVYCSFATPGKAPYLNCVQSNPVYTGTADKRVTNVGVATYAPSYNSLGAGNCNPATQGLLEPQYFECNVNNKQLGAGLSNVCPNTGALSSCSQTKYQDVALCLSTCWANHGAAGCPAVPTGIGPLTDPQSYCSQALSDYSAYTSCAASYTGGSPQFCEQTDYTTGNGICSSQVGLIDSNPAGTGIGGTQPSVYAPITDNNGDFGPVTITACGSRSDKITAVYYGWPPPEPVSVTQLPLAFAANAVNGNGCVGTCSQFLSQEQSNPPSTLQSEFNYRYAPAQTSQPVQIGIFQLSYNDVGIAATLAAMATALLMLFWRELLPRRRRRR